MQSPRLLIHPALNGPLPTRHALRSVILHNTIASPAVGGGAIVAVSGTVGISDTIIASYTTGISQIAGKVCQDYDLFFGNGANTAGAVNGGTHSFTGDPRFVKPAVNGYHIIAGLTTRLNGVNFGVATVFEGDRRPLSGAVDIGLTNTPYDFCCICRSSGGKRAEA